jgi:hypothetical protein
MDKFLITNRFKNLESVTDMNSIRQVFHRVQDMFTSLDHFILETYILPSCYQEMSRRIIKERIEVPEFTRKNSKEV